MDNHKTNHIHPQNFSQGTGYLMPTGRYWIGDPAYVLHKDLYKQLIQSQFYTNDYCAINVDGKTIACMSTAYGDGTFTDKNGLEYSVDSGFLSIVPEIFVGRRNTTDEFDSIKDVYAGNYFFLDKETAFVKDNNNIFHLGDITEINTDDDTQLIVVNP